MSKVKGMPKEAVVEKAMPRERHPVSPKMLSMGLGLMGFTGVGEKEGALILSTVDALLQLGEDFSLKHAAQIKEQLNPEAKPHGQKDTKS